MTKEEWVSDACVKIGKIQQDFIGRYQRMTKRDVDPFWQAIDRAKLSSARRIFEDVLDALQEMVNE